MRIQALLAILLLGLLGLGPINSATAQGAATYEYLDVQPPQPTSVPGKIEVLEFFMYTCPHCNHFEPYIEQWEKELKDDVVFIPVPAIFNPLAELHARAFYTAEVLGVLDKSHSALFKAIHEQHQQLIDQAALARFFTQFGVSEDAFNRTFNSFTVNNRIARARYLLNAYKIDGVPTMIVNGKYKTSATITGSHPRTLEVVNDLIEMERQKS